MIDQPEKKKNINPNFQKVAKKQWTVDSLLVQLSNGNKLALSQALSMAESVLASDRKLINQVLKNYNTTGSKRIAITGPPGAGKSTFIDTLGTALCQSGNKLAVLSIDPSSPQSGGSILGDKTRMEKLQNEANAYIRPSASGKEKGGVSAATMESILLCEMAGFQYIFVETVGVGQSEVAVADLVDLYLLIIQPGSGDELQGIKRGIMELADLYVVNKADGDKLELAKLSAKAINGAKSLLSPKQHRIKPSTLLFSSVSKLNLEQTIEAIDQFFIQIIKSDYYSLNRKEQFDLWFQKIIERSIVETVEEIPEIQEIKTSLQDKISHKDLYPIEAGEIIKKAILSLISSKE